MIATPRRAPIERASPSDLLELVSDRSGTPMQVAAVLTLDRSVDIEAACRALEERVTAIPRLRQRLAPTPAGFGRPVWVDDSTFDIRNHIHAHDCPPPGDESAVLEVAAAAVRERLLRSRPLWSATLVTGPAGGRSALVFVVHHVLTDGIGGLALLAQLVDGAPAVLAPAVTFPAPAPTRFQLLTDATASRLRAVVAAPSGLRLVRDAWAELSVGRRLRAPRCSLNQPTGPRRQVAVVRADLGAVSTAAHAHGATVNDVLLAAVGGALAAVLRHRGEAAESFVVSVPVSARREEATATQLGNQVGAMPVEVPAQGPPVERLHAVTRATRAHRLDRGRGASAALLGPAFRMLAGIGAFQWFVDHQHLVTTFVTNVRGPAQEMTFLGARVTDLAAVTLVSGNVTVTFAVLSYAGTLAVTVNADPDTCPDLPVLVAALRRELDELLGSSTAAIGPVADGSITEG